MAFGQAEFGHRFDDPARVVALGTIGLSEGESCVRNFKIGNLCKLFKKFLRWPSKSLRSNHKQIRTVQLPIETSVGHVAGRNVLEVLVADHVDDRTRDTRAILEDSLQEHRKPSDGAFDVLRGCEEMRVERRRRSIEMVHFQIGMQ